jgi:hypothetical protein
MNETLMGKSVLTNLLSRQIKWLNDSELDDLSNKFNFDKKPLNGGWTFCHYIVHEGYLKPFVDFCKSTYDAKVKKRQNPPKWKTKDILVMTVDLGKNLALDNEKLDLFARSLDWPSYSEFQSQKILKKRELTDDEKYAILVTRYEKHGLDVKIFDSYRWRPYWLAAIDAIHAELEAEEDQYGNWGYGF